MNIFHPNLLEGLSFPDANVDKVEFRPTDKVLTFFVDRAHLDTGLDCNLDYDLDQSSLVIHGWTSMKIRRFDSPKNKWSDVDENVFEPLKDICECQFSKELACLRGFGKHTGQWTEFLIAQAKIELKNEAIGDLEQLSKNMTRSTVQIPKT